LQYQEHVPARREEEMNRPGHREVATQTPNRTGHRSRRMTKVPPIKVTDFEGKKTSVDHQKDQVMTDKPEHSQMGRQRHQLVVA
jgi:hypothetical protein